MNDILRSKNIQSKNLVTEERAQAILEDAHTKLFNKYHLEPYEFSQQQYPLSKRILNMLKFPHANFNAQQLKDATEIVRSTMTYNQILNRDYWDVCLTPDGGLLISLLTD